MAGFQNMAALLCSRSALERARLRPEHPVYAHPRAHGFHKAVEPAYRRRDVRVDVERAENRRKDLPLLVGLGCGTAVYYVLELAGHAQALGPVIGALPQGRVVPRPFSNFADLGYHGRLAELAPTILSGALALAVIAAFDALLCSRLVNQPDDKPIDGDRLLIRLGLGNAISACFGGITGESIFGASLTNRAFGARTPVSVVVNAAMILIMVAVLFPYLAYLPRAVCWP